MNRRSFLKTAAVASLAATLGKSESSPTATPPSPRAEKALVKPRRLSPGDTVALISPGSGLKSESFDRGVRNLESIGLEVKVGRHARGKEGLFSGDEAQRVEDLHWAFSDPEIRGVWCARGGTGVQRILPLVDFALLARNPKVFVGFSDITALDVAIFEQCGFVTFHGPVAATSFSDYSKAHMLAAVMSSAAPYRIEVAPANAAQSSDLYRTHVLVPGKARGRLIGGNLTVLASLCGTPWALASLKGKILFLEDVDEEPRRIERMLTQLRQSVDLRALAGIAFGVCDGCVATEKSPSPPVIDVIKSHVAELGVPAVYGLSIGHLHDQCTLPIGLEAELDADRAAITLLESAVS
jgi:muramoyltetrapeptide carboxypeptidase